MIEDSTPSPVSCLILLTSAQIGGAERVVLDLLEGKTQGKVDYSVLLPTQGRIINDLESLGIPYSILSFGKMAVVSRAEKGLIDTLLACIQVLTYLLRLRTFVKKKKIQVIYSHGLKSDFFSAMATWGLPVRIIWHLHVFPPRKGLFARLYQILSHRVSLAIANSSAVKEWCQPLIKAPLEVVYCAIRGDQFHPRPREYAWQSIGANYNSEQFCVGMVSALAPWKGIDIFLQAIAPLMKKYPRWRAVICGEIVAQTRGHAHYDSELKELAKNLEIADKVNFLPFQNEPANIFSLLDITVHASKLPEPFGRVVSESRLCGSIIVASSGGGVPEQVSHGENGFLVGMGDVAGLSGILEKIYARPVDYSGVRESGILWVQENLGLGKFIKKIESHLISVVCKGES